MQQKHFAGLRSYVAGGEDDRGGGRGPVVVLMHGFGAAGDDLVDLAHVLQLPNRPRFVFPEAPLSLDGGPGRAWWMLDMELFERRARGERIDRSGEIPPRLPAVRQQVTELLAEVTAFFGIGASRLVLGGFSQGSMVACDVALHADEKPAALLLLSSTLIAEPVWKPLMPSLSKLSVFQSHGRLDPLLPFEDAERLADLLRSGGADLSFMEFMGGHEIPPAVLAGMARTIVKLG
jgi:phospholipase/carboxylesterase